MTTAVSIFMWTQVARRLVARAPGTRFSYAKHIPPHPRQAGAHVSVGLPAGQMADYRFAPDGSCRGVHVLEYPNRGVVHLDQVHPDCDALEHLRRDAPGTWCLGGAVWVRRRDDAAGHGLAAQGSQREGDRADAGP